MNGWESRELEVGCAWAFSDFARWKRGRECVYVPVPPPAAMWGGFNCQALCSDLSVLRWVAAGSPVPGVFLDADRRALTGSRIVEMVGSASARDTMARLIALGLVGVHAVPVVLGRGSKSALDVVDESPEYPVFPLRGGRGWRLKESDVAMLAGAYPNVDIQAEAKRAHAWLMANPERRKTASGMLRFVRGWVERAERYSVRRNPVPVAARPQSKPEVGYDPNTVVVPPDEAFLAGD